MGFVYANAGSGASANVLGWADFGPGFIISPGQTIPFSGQLANNINVKFDLTLLFLGGTPRDYTAAVPPVNGSYFGSAGYTGINGNVVLYSDPGTANNLSSLVINNIVVTNAKGEAMPNYTIVIADGESTSGTPIDKEGLLFITNGGDWVLLDSLGTNNPPPIIGGGKVIGIQGELPPLNVDYVYYTQSPTAVTVNLSAPQTTDRQGIAIGFIATQVELYKEIDGRRYATDQFDLSIGGTPSVIETTTGASSGLQSVYASVSAIPGNVYTINEAMAAGSTSLLTDYTQTVSVQNLTIGGTIPVIGPLPTSVTPALGDIIQYTIKNIPNPIINKTVSPEFAQPGDNLTYTVTVQNPNTAAISNVLIVDPTPAGTTYVGNLLVSVPYTGSNPDSGITLTSIPGGATATLSWEVKIDNALPEPNPISNVANISVNGGAVINTPAAETQVNFADLTSPGNFIKTASPTTADIGDVVTYTISITNGGNVPATNVVITDSISSGTSYVNGSINGNLAFSGDPVTGITLTNPLAVGATATFTFDVVVNSFAINPIPNTASVAYNFTVDPAVLNGGAASGNSTTSQVEVSSTALVVTKKADKSIAYLDDIITYTITVANTGNAPASNVIITDAVPSGTTYEAASLTGTVPVTGAPPTINITNPIAGGETVSVSFKVKVTGNPAVNPISNVATVDYQSPTGENKTSTSNQSMTTLFKYNFRQQITDIINSVSNEEAALAAIRDAEGAKLQRIVNSPNVTPQQLLCVNKSVNEMEESIQVLHNLLVRKLRAVECQIDDLGNC